ncbi:MAG: MBL fold metallo-hydrolase [Deltaproteobacteria bacterium]|nr:MBL fold metallo-hydrolase [Deltaproteobacteria bacterium]
MKYIEGIYAYEWGSIYENNCNSFYLGEGINALIDPGLSAYLPDLLERMAKDGVKREEIAFVFNTHSHPDHFQGSEILQAEKTSIALHTEEINFLNGVGVELYSLFGIPAPEGIVNMPLEEGRINIAGQELQIIHVPGHSPGSVAIYWENKKALFCGDVIFEQNVGRTDFPGGNSALLKESISRLALLDVEHLFAGHMGIISGKREVEENFAMVIKQIFPYL